MRMATTPTTISSTPNGFFKDAVTEYAYDADILHQAGRTNATAQPFPPVPNEPNDVRQKRALGQVAAGLKQLGQAAELEAKVNGYSGYAKVVDLMTTTADAASTVCGKIKAIVNAGVFNAHDISVLNTLNDTLRGLAALSPAAIWTHPVPDDVEKK
jgi:hypothetical protein